MQNVEDLFIFMPRFWLCRIFPRISEDYCQEGNKSHAHRVVEIAHDRDWRYLCQFRRHEQLRSVRYKSLRKAREGVEDTCASTRVYVEFGGNIPCYRTCCYHRHRIVCRTHVGYYYQSGDAHLGSALAVYMLQQKAGDELNSAVVSYQFQHSAGKQGYYYKFAHAQDAVAHAAEPRKYRKLSRNQSDNACEDDAEKQHNHHVHAEDNGYQYGKIRYDIKPFNVWNLLRRMDVETKHDVRNHYDDGGRHHDSEVDLELVAHLAALRLRGYYRCVGYKRQIVAEECSAHDRCHNHRQTCSCLGGYSGGNRG